MAGCKSVCLYPSPTTDTNYDPPRLLDTTIFILIRELSSDDNSTAASNNSSRQAHTFNYHRAAAAGSCSSATRNGVTEVKIRLGVRRLLYGSRLSSCLPCVYLHRLDVRLGRAASGHSVWHPLSGTASLAQSAFSFRKHYLCSVHELVFHRPNLPGQLSHLLLAWIRYRKAMYEVTESTLCVNCYRSSGVVSRCGC
jgi:hypothetical protein